MLVWVNVISQDKSYKMRPTEKELFGLEVFHSKKCWNHGIIFQNNKKLFKHILEVNRKVSKRVTFRPGYAFKCLSLTQPCVIHDLVNIFWEILHSICRESGHLQFPGSLDKSNA